MENDTKMHRDGGEIKNTGKPHKTPVSGVEKDKKKYVKNASAVVAAWRRDNPRGHKSELYKTGLVSLSSINRYWNSCGEGEQPLSASEKVILWRYDNPLGTKKQCQEETGLSRRSVFLHWEDKSQPKSLNSKKTDSEDDEIKVSVDKIGQQFFDF